MISTVLAWAVMLPCAYANDMNVPSPAPTDVPMQNSAFERIIDGISGQFTSEKPKTLSSFYEDETDVSDVVKQPVQIKPKAKMKESVVSSMPANSAPAKNEFVLQSRKTMPLPETDYETNVNALQENEGQAGIEPAAGHVATQAEEHGGVEMAAESAVEDSHKDMAPEKEHRFQNLEEEAYKLGPGDVLKVTVYGEPDLTNTYRVSQDGYIAVPLVGDLKAAGLSIAGLEQSLAHRLSEGYLKDPTVSIEMTTARPFFILGEVRLPGSYDYLSDMSVLNAVAVAGGFTYRANKKEVELLRPSEGEDTYQKVSVSEKILPGDIVLIKERFF